MLPCCRVDLGRNTNTQAHVFLLPYTYIDIRRYIYIYTDIPVNPFPMVIYHLVDGSILGCWLQVAEDLVTYWLSGY